jgi:hypothetical protein
MKITGMSACFAAGLLTATGAETVYDTTVAIPFSIDGKLYSKAAVANGATPTSDGDGNAFATLAASQGCVMLWCLKADGTVGVFQSDIGSLDGSDEFDSAELPNFPTYDTEVWVPFAYMVLKNGAAGSTFTFGSSNWNATGMTVAIQDISTLPSRPQSS